METVLKISGLSKTMGKRLIIDNISLETYSGEVFGFLGPNGAGKTTTIKMILGLLDVDAGEIEIAGVNVRKRFEQAMSMVGGIVENPETYGYLTGLQNLRQYKRMRTGVSEERLDEIVKLVGLENRINDKVKKYSLGMKQRLGLAQAIMHSPKLLILDEPTNGLDPVGIRELRDILKNLAHEHGVAVFVSSHMLSEMELMCDRVGIISNGRLIDVKTTKELIEQASSNTKIMRFTVSPIEKAQEVFAGMGITPVDIAENTVDVAVESDEAVGAITAALVGAGISLLGAAPLEHSLEDVFIKIVGGEGGQIA